MYLGSHKAVVTMAGLDKAAELANTIHEKSIELRNLVAEFNALTLELGIEVMPTPADVEVTEKDQM